MTQFDPNQPPRLDSQGFPIKLKKRHTGRNAAIIAGSVLGGLILIGVLSPSDPAKEAADKLPNVVTTTSAPKASLAPTQPPKASAPPKTTAPVVEPEVTTEAPSMTRSQEQAVGKAESYLDYSAFSLKGLIEQLEYEGFTKADATYAVGHIEVSWNEQAAKKAESYLEMTQFSRSGLIQQLEFEGFTHKQAVYGVSKAGL